MYHQFDKHDSLSCLHFRHYLINFPFVSRGSADVLVLQHPGTIIPNKHMKQKAIVMLTVKMEKHEE